MSSRTHGLTLAVAAAGSLALASCAELRVDVDVYKGPLANHEEVLTEQFAITASAAKPVLENLRYELARSHWKACWKEAKRENSKPLQRAYRYNVFKKPDKLADCNRLMGENSTEIFTEKIAERFYAVQPALHISRIFALYDDNKVIAIIRQFFDRLADYNTKIAKESATIQDTSFIVDQALEILILFGNDDAIRLLGLEKTMRNRIIDLTARLLSAVLQPRNMEMVLYRMPEEPRVKVLRDEFVGQIERRGPRSNKQYDYGRNPTALYNALINKPVQMARAIQFLRQQIIFDTSLSADAAKENAKQAAQHAADELIKAQQALNQAEQKHRQATETLDEYIKTLEAKQNDAETEGSDTSIEILRKDVEKADQVVEQTKQDVEVKEALRDSAKKNAISKAQISSDVDEFYRDDYIKGETQDHSGSTRPSARSRNALVRARNWILRADHDEPNTDANKQEGKDSGPFKPGIIQAVNLSDFVQTKGFGNARLKEGLETLIREYLNTEDRELTDCITLNCKPQLVRLQKALVRFAEKVVYAANNGELVSHNIDTDTDDVKKYRLTLQALGNTLIVYANELSHSRTFRENQENAFYGELVAANMLRYRNAVAIYTDLHKDLTFRKDAVEKDRKKATKTEKEQTYAVNDALALAQKTAGVFQSSLQSAPQAAGLPSIDTAIIADTVDYKVDGNRQAALKALQPVRDKIAAQGLYEFLKGKLTVLNGSEDKEFSRAEFADALYMALFKMADADPAIDTASIIALRAKIESDAFRDSTLCSCADDAFKATPKAWLEKLTLHLLESRPVWVKPLQQSLAAFETALSTLSTAQQTLKAKTAEKNKLVKRLKALGVAIAAADTAKTKAGKTGSRESKITADYRAVVDENIEIDTSGSGPTKADVLAELAFWTPTLNKPLLACPKSDGTSCDTLYGRKLTSRDVVDATLQQLEQAYIQAVSDHGAKSPSAENMKAAVKAAHDYRSKKVMIRPPTAYLRSGLAASALQSGGDTEFSGNNLGAHFWDTIKLWNKKDKDEKLRIQLDAQFWQTINTVRVAGGGSTNYAIAKDPVGNWYVKGYSSDPKAVINSAKGLALYAAGQKRNLDLNNLDDEGNPVNTSPTGLGKIYQKYQKQYGDSTEEDRKKLLALLDDGVGDNATTLRKRVNNVALRPEDPNDLGGKLENAYEAAFKDARGRLQNAAPDTSEAERKDAGQAIISALQAMDDFKNEITTIITADVKEIVAPKPETPKACPTTKEDGTSYSETELKNCATAEEERVKTANDEAASAHDKAVRDEKEKAAERAAKAVEIVRAEIESYVKRRTLALDEYENASKFLVESIN